MERIKNELPQLPDNSILISTIKGYECCEGYAIDIDANLWSCKAHNFKSYCFESSWRINKTKNNRLGYPFVILSCFGKDVTVRIHRLISLAFIPNPNNFTDVNHINGIKTDNRIDNLEWVTHSYNCQHAIDNNLRNTARGEKIKHAILTEDNVKQMFEMRKNGAIHKEIAYHFKIDISSVSRILNKKSWKHVNP